MFRRTGADNPPLKGGGILSAESQPDTYPEKSGHFIRSIHLSRIEELTADAAIEQNREIRPMVSGFVRYEESAGGCV
jgi:hypothetical protein